MIGTFERHVYDQFDGLIFFPTLTVDIELSGEQRKIAIAAK